MKLSLAFLLLLIFSLEMSESEERPSPAMSAEEFVKQYEAALASQDWAAVAPLVHPNCTVTFSSGSVHRGVDEVKAAFSRNFKMIKDEKYAISEVHWILKKEGFSVFTFTYDWSGTIDGNAVSGSGRGTSSLVKEDGKWLLISEHLGSK